MTQEAAGVFRFEIETASECLPWVRSWTDEDGRVCLGLASGDGKPTEVRLTSGPGFALVALSVSMHCDHGSEHAQ